jgi:hypothetical protein
LDVKSAPIKGIFDTHGTDESLSLSLLSTIPPSRTVWPDLAERLSKLSVYL